MDFKFVCIDCKKIVSEEMLALHIKHSLKDLGEIQKQAEKNLKAKKAVLAKAELQLEIISRNADAVKNTLLSEAKRESSEKKAIELGTKLIKVKKEIDIVSSMEEVKGLGNIKKDAEEFLKKYGDKAKLMIETDKKIFTISDEFEKAELMSKFLMSNPDIKELPEKDYKQTMKTFNNFLNIIQKIHPGMKLIPAGGKKQHKFIRWLRSMVPVESDEKKIAMFSNLFSVLGMTKEDTEIYQALLSLFTTQSLMLAGLNLNDDIIEDIVPMKENLRALYLNDNKITQKGVEMIGRYFYEGDLRFVSFENCKALEKSSFSEFLKFERLGCIDISGTGANSPECMKTISTLMRKRMEALIMSNNNLTKESINILVESAKEVEHGSLRILLLNDNPIGDDGVVSILKQEWIENAKAVSFENVGLTSNGLQRLVDREKLKLTILDIARNPDLNTPEAAETILKICEEMEGVHLGYCRLNNQWMTAFTNAILKSEKNTDIGFILNGNSFDADSVDLFFKCIDKVKTVYTNFSNCPIGDLGASNIAKFMKDHECKVLLLQDTGLTIEGVLKLCESATPGKGYGLLNLAGAKLADATPDQMKKLGKLLCQAEIEQLNLAHCGLGDAHLKALGEGLTDKPKFESLNLDGNPFGTKGLIDLLSASKWCSNDITIHMQEVMPEPLNVVLEKEKNRPIRLEDYKDLLVILYIWDKLLYNKSIPRQPVAHGPRENLLDELAELMRKGFELPKIPFVITKQWKEDIEEQIEKAGMLKPQEPLMPPQVNVVQGPTHPMPGIERPPSPLLGKK